MNRTPTPTRFTSRPSRIRSQTVIANEPLRYETSSIGNRLRNIPIQVYEEGAAHNLLRNGRYNMNKYALFKQIWLSLLYDIDMKDLDFYETDFIEAIQVTPMEYEAFFFRSHEIAVDTTSYIDFIAHSFKIIHENLKNRIIYNRFTPQQMEIVKNAIQIMIDNFDKKMWNERGYEDVFRTLAANKHRMLEYISLNKILDLLNCKIGKGSGCAIMGGKRKTRKQLKKSRKKYRKRKTKKYMKKSNKN